MVGARGGRVVVFSAGELFYPSFPVLRSANDYERTPSGQVEMRALLCVSISALLAPFKCKGMQVFFVNQKRLRDSRL